jgi:hypothetical protein
MSLGFGILPNLKKRVNAASVAACKGPGAAMVKGRFFPNQE